MFLSSEDPPTLAQELPTNPETFEIAHRAGLVLTAHTFDLVDRQLGYGVVPVENRAVLSDFSGAIPQTEFSTMTLTHTPFARGIHQRISVVLYDAKVPDRQIVLTELERSGNHSNIFSIGDTHPYRERRARSQVTVEAETVRRFLEAQLYYPEKPLHSIPLHELVEFFAPRTTEFTSESRTGMLSLGPDVVLHAMRNASRAPTNFSDVPDDDKYAVWISTAADKTLATEASDVVVRIIAEFNAKDYEDPKNTLRYEIEAASIQDLVGLIRRFKLSRAAARKLSSCFVQNLDDYTANPPHPRSIQAANEAEPPTD